MSTLQQQVPESASGSSKRQSLTVREMLQQEIASLSEMLAEEVFDFVLFVKARRAEESFLWEQVEATYAYRRTHPEETVTATAICGEYSPTCPH